MEVASYSLSGESERILDSTVVQEYAYVYNGSSLMQMVVQTTVDDGEPVTETLYFSYDASGIPMSLVYNGTDYYYTVSLQGDVTAILNTSGTAVVEYTYDAWGNILTVTGSMANTLGAVNPLTYRGYVYDTETGLYYLQSRYYNPETGRFLNADGYMATGQGLLGNNMFAYCNNNPVRYCDPSGDVLIEALVVAVGTEWAITIVVGGIVIISGVVYKALETFVDWLSRQWYRSCLEITYAAEQPKDPDVTYPGDDPAKAPEGTEWKGKGEQGSNRGNYHNPETGESWHPDLDHPEPIGPHWDYRDPSGIWWRIGPGNIISLK